MSNTKKIVFLTLLITFLIQGGIFMLLGWIFYTHYESFANANSGISTKPILTDLVLQPIPTLTLTQTQDHTLLYFGILGDLTKTTQKNTTTEFKETTVQYFRLDHENIKKALIIEDLKRKHLLDVYIFEYLKELQKTEFFFAVNDLFNYRILLGLSDAQTIASWQSLLDVQIQDFFSKANTQIQHQAYQELSNTLFLLEKSAYDTTSVLKNIPNETSFLSSQGTQYVLGKLLKDPKYHQDIQKVSQIFSLDEKLLISAIGVEQIRYMTTARGYAKNMILENKYLTNFSQMSHGLGGIKVKTARKIIDDLKISNPRIFQAYFQQDEAKSDAEIVAKLQDPFGGVLYAGALITTIQYRWERAGISLKYKPGITLTLYNMGNPENKIPNQNPQLGGSLIEIEGKQMYFGEIGYVLYEYLKYYVE